MKILGVNEAKVLQNRAQETWQMHLIYEVQTEHMNFKPGVDDAEALKFVSKEALGSTEDSYAKLVHAYVDKTKPSN